MNTIKTSEDLKTFLDRQKEMQSKRESQDSKWATSKPIKEVKKDTYKICKISTRLSRKGWVSYSCEIRKGSSRGKTVCWVDQEGVGGSEFINVNFKLFSKDELDKIEDYIYENCLTQWIEYCTQIYLMEKQLKSVDNNDSDLREYLLPYKKAFINKDINEMHVESLIGWWTEDTANNKYYS